MDKKKKKNKLFFKKLHGFKRNKSIDIYSDYCNIFFFKCAIVCNFHVLFFICHDDDSRDFDMIWGKWYSKMLETQIGIKGALLIQTGMVMVFQTARKSIKKLNLVVRNLTVTYSRHKRVHQSVCSSLCLTCSTPPGFRKVMDWRHLSDRNSS